jgi:hypothetical protein
MSPTELLFPPESDILITEMTMTEHHLVVVATPLKPRRAAHSAAQPQTGLTAGFAAPSPICRSETDCSSCG